MFLAALKRGCELRGLEKKVDPPPNTESIEDNKDEGESIPSTAEEKFMYSIKELIRANKKV